MGSKLFFKISQGEERVARIEAFVIFSVTALHLAVMSGSIRADEFMLNTKLGGCFLKKGLNIPFAVGKTVGKSKPLSVWTHSTQISLWAYHFTIRFKKSAEE